MIKSVRKGAGEIAGLGLALLIAVDTAHASGGGMPWEGPIQQIIDSVSGPVAKAIAVGAIIVTGLGLAFGEGGNGMKRLHWVVMGLRLGFCSTGLRWQWRKGTRSSLRY